MKVIIFSTAYFPFVGGAEIAVKEITDRLPEIEFDMMTARLSNKIPKRERIGNINIYRIGIGVPKFDKYLLMFFGHVFAKKLHKKNKYNITWAIMASYGGFAASRFKRKNREVKYLLSLQEGDSLAHIARRVRFINRSFNHIFSRADFIQTISSFLADWAREMGAKRKIQVVPNGVDYETFAKEVPPDELDALRGKLGKRGGDRFIVTVSRLVEKNAVGELIRSLDALDSNYKLLVVGTGEKENELRGIAHRHGLGSRVKFLGQIDYSELPKYYKISDVFCRPSLSEGFGNVFVEAMAAGIPVVATPVGGITDFLFDPDKNTDREPTGLFCEVRNPESIAKQVRRLVEDEVLRTRIVNNAREMVREKYDWRIVARDMEGIFVEVINDKIRKSQTTNTR